MAIVKVNVQNDSGNRNFMVTEFFLRKDQIEAEYINLFITFMDLVKLLPQKWTTLISKKEQHYFNSSTGKYAKSHSFYLDDIYITNFMVVCLWTLWMLQNTGSLIKQSSHLVRCYKLTCSLFQA